MSKKSRSRLWSRWLSRKPAAEIPARGLGMETLEDRLAPATFTWTGAGANALWSTAANWQGNVGPAQAPPGSTLDLVFPSGAARPAMQNDLATGTVINKITIQGQGTVGGTPTAYSFAEAPDPAVNSIVLGTGSPASGNFTVQSGAGSVTFALPLTLASNGDQSISVGSSGTTLSITSAVTAPAVNNLNKDGDGRLVLAAANPNLLGGVKVNAGSLQIGSTLSLGPAGGIETVVSSGAGLYLNNVTTAAGQTTIGEQVRLNGGGFDPTQGALFLEAGNATWSGQVILETGVTRPTQAGGPGTVIGAGLDAGGNPLTLTITGVVSDSGAGMGLIKEGAGEVKLSPASANGNTYRGQTNINNGILTITHSLALGDSRQTNPAAFDTPTAGTVVNVSPGRSGQLRLQTPAGGPAVKVVGEYLVLNGTGNDGRGALYSTLGDNTWAGKVILGSKQPDGRDVTIGVEAAASPAAPSTLTISGVVSDPDSPIVGGVVQPYSLTKVRGGRLFLTNANTYRGTTFISAGAIVIRDSQGLGPANGGFQTGTTTTPAAPTGETIVSAGAALELDVEAAYAQSVVPRFDDLGRDTWADSVTNDAQKLSVSEKLTISGRGPGATNAGTGITATQSTGGTGALRSWTGINTWAAGITLGSDEAAIGVELDGSRTSVSGTTSRAGHPLPDSSYFRDDYSLTIQDPATSGTIGIAGATNTDFVKVGAGHLILPQANPYTGRTLIEQGWVTVQNNRSLGATVSSLGKTAQQPTIVKAGAALHIRPTAPNNDLQIAEESIIIEGLGLGSLAGQEQHPFSFINQQGALVNLGGNNTILGDVGVISTGFGTAAERGAGIGVERAATVESPVGSGNYVTLPSTLTISGDLSDGVTYQPSFSNATPVTATPGAPAPGQLDAVGTRVYNVGATRGRISVPYNFGTTPQRLQIYYPDASTPANLIYDTGDVAAGGAGAVTGVGLATVNFGSASSSGTTVVVKVTPGANAANPAWQVGVANIANTPHGVVTQFPSSFVKLGSETLVLQGAGSESGKKNEIREGTLLLQNDTGLGRATTGTEVSQQTYDVTETVVATAATLQLAGSVSPQEGGVEAGVHVQDEKLTLNRYGVQIRVAGQPTARYRIAYGGRQTDLLQVPSGYTGAPGTYAAYLQDQINTKLPNIAGDLTAGVPGATPADAAAVVTELTPGVYSITFGAARFKDFDFSSLSAVIEPISLPTVTSLAEVRISGSNAPLNALSDDNSWRGPVTLNSGTRIVVGQDSRLALLGDVLEGAAANAPGSDLVKRGLGDLMLGGQTSNYRGVTYIDKGIVTAVSSRAFGAPSTGAYDPNIAAAPGGTAVKTDAQLQIQGTITIAGEGLAAEGNGAPVAPTIDSTIRWQNVGVGATNNGVAPPYTPPTPGAPTSGRIDSIATDPTDPRVIYVATAGGGAWKTKDGGLTWIPLFDLGVDAATNQPLAPANDAGGTLLPLSAMMFAGQIAVAPSNPQVVYYGTGDANGEYNGIPNPGQVDNYAGSGVYKSTDGGKTWTRLLKSDGTNPLYGQAVTKMIVDPLNADRLYVATGVVRQVPTTPAGVPPLPVSLLNGSLNAATQAGVWRYTTPVGTEEGWVNLVGRVSALRQTKGQAPFDGSAPNPLGTLNAGPDDDFRIRFPFGTTNDQAESATWSDIQLVLRGVNPNTGRMQYTLYAALGESTQTYFLGANAQAIRNGVYRTDDPELAMPDATADGPSWWLGQGTHYPIIGVADTPVDQRTAGLDVGVIPPPVPANPPWPGRFGYIKIAAASVADEVWAGSAPFAVRVLYADVTLYAGALWRDPYTLDSQNPRMPAPLDAQRGEIREFLKATAVPNQYPATYIYTLAAPPPSPFGTATGSSYLTQRPATGRYNFTLAVRDYDPRTIADNNPTEVFLGGLDSLYRSVDGASTWATLGPDAGGFAPAESHHAITFDTSNRLLVGTDGGLWRWDRLRFSNLNSNLPVVQFASVDAHPIDFRQAVGGTAGNGTQLWNGNTVDGSAGSWSRVDNLSTTPNGGQSGSVSGVVKYDPFNPTTIYAVRDGVLRRSDDGGATWPLSFSYTASLPITPPGPLNTFPLIVDPVNQNRIVFGGGNNPGVLIESTDKGVSRTPIPAPLTPTVIALAGYQGDFVADPSFTTVNPTLPNVKNPDTIYISDGRNIQVTKNRGVSWAARNIALPADATITDLIVNPVNRDEVYAAVSARPGATGGRVWRSTDAGRTWTDLTGTYDPAATNDAVGPLPLIPTHKLALDPRTGTLYVGNDNGVWVLVDANATDPANVARTAVTGAGSVMYWKRFGDGMPNVAVRDLVVNQVNSTLTAGTYGRGAFQLFLTDYAARSGAIRAVSGSSQWTGPVVLTGDVTISAVGTQKIQNGVSAAQLDFGGTISDAAGGPFDITKTGRGTVIFSGANTYAGVTDITDGVLEVKDPNALGSAAGNTIVRYGAALQVRSDIELEPITLNGDGISFNGHYTGALRNISGQNTYNGPLTLGTESTTGAPLPDDNDLRQVTIGTDSGSSLKIGQNPTGQNPAAVGHVQSSTDRILTINFASAAPAGTNWGQVTAAGSVAGPLTAITMRQGAGAAVPEVQQFAIPLTAQFVTFTSPEKGVIGPFDTSSPTFAADVEAGFRAAYPAADPTNPLTVQEDRNGIDKELTGTLILASANTGYLGLTQVYAGAVEVRDGQALGPVAGSAPTRVSDGAAVRIANVAPNTPTVVTAESLFLSGTGTPDGPGGAGTGALRNTGGNNTWNGPIELTDIPNFAPLTNPAHQIAFGVSNAADVLSVGPAAGITEDYATYGQFGLIKVGPGALRLTAANQYTGVTNINEGTVRAANDQALGATTASSEVQTIRVFGGGAGAAGQYQLTVNGIPTGVLTNNPAGVSSTAAQVQAEIEKLIAGGAPGAPAAPDVFVSATPNASGNVFTVTFRGRYTGQNVPQLGSVNVAPGITVTIATPQEGGVGTVVAAGASLELDNTGLAAPVTVSETLTINGQGVTDPDGYRYGALGSRGPLGTTNTYAGDVTFGSATSVGAQAGSTLRVTGRVLGQALDPTPATTGPTVPATAELTKVGFGTTYFQGAKEYRGRTVVSEGALLINNAGSLGVGRNEVQQIRVVGKLDQPADDTEKFTLTLFGETTDAITLFSDPTAAANELLAKLTTARTNSPTQTNGPILSAADVDVTAVVTPPGAGETRGEVQFTVTFKGRYANTNVPLLTDISPSTPQSVPAALVVNTNPQGQPGTNEKQTFILPNQGGTFTLTGFATPARAFNVPLATLQADFNTRFGAGNTVLTQTVLPGNTGRLIEVTYTGTLAGQNVAQLAGTFTPTLRVRVDGVDGVGAEAQVVDVRNAVGLQYSLAYVNPFTGQPVAGTRLLGANSTDAEFASALLDPQSLGGLGIGDGMVVATTTPGQASPATNEVQTFVIPNGTGSFTIVGRRPAGASFNVGPFAFNALLSDIQTAFDAAYGAGDTLLSESTLPDNGGRLITVRFQGTLSAVDVPQIRGIFNNVTVTRTTSPGGFQYLVQFTGTYGNINVLPLTTAIVNGGATIVVTTLQDGYEGTVVNPGASLQTVDLPAISSEWVTLNGGGRSKVQTLDVARAGAGSGTYTLRYTNPTTGLPVIGTRVLTVGDAAGTVASSTAAEFAAALTDPVALGGLGLGAGNVSVTRTDTAGGATYTIVFTGALRDVQFSNIVPNTSTGVGSFGIAELEAGGGGALRMRDSAGNFTTVWGDPTSVSPLILGSSASIGVESSTDVLRLKLATTDRNQYAAPTPVLGPTGVRGANQGLSLTKVGVGTLEFNAIGDNDYTGATLVNDGTLLLNHTHTTASHNAVRGPLVVGDNIDAGGFNPAAPLSQTAVVRLANRDEIANAPSVTVNADGLLDLHGWIETIGNLAVNGGVVDTQKPAVPAFPVVAAGVSVAGPELTTGTVTMNDGQFIVRGGDQASTGTITATNTAEVIVDPNAGLTSGAVDLTGSSLSVGANATADTQGATITARRGPAPGSVRSTITTGTGATLTTVSGATRGAVTLTDSDLTAGVNSQTQIGALTLNKDATLPATGSTASFLTGATLDTGGADIAVNESDLSTGTGVAVNPTSPAGNLTATGTVADRSAVTFGAGTTANFRSVNLTLADLHAGANVVVTTTGTTAPNQGVTLTDATADFAADATLTTAGGGLSLTRSTLTGTVGLDVNTQAVSLADNSTLDLGAGPSATLNTNGRTISVTQSTLTTGDGAVINPTNPAGALTATGSVARPSAVNLGPNSTSTFASTTLDRTGLTTGTAATLNAGPVLATNSTITTGGGSVTNTGSVGLTDTNLTFGAGSTNAVTGNLTTFDTPATADDGNVVFGTGSTTTVSGGVAATNAAVSVQDNAAVTAAGLALSEAQVGLQTNATLSVSGGVSVAATANGSATSGPGTLRLTGPAAADQTITVFDGAASEDFTIGSGLTAANGQTVVKAGPGRLTLAPAASGSTLTTLLRVAAGDAQVDTVTGPVQVDAGGTVSGNGSTGPITVPGAATVSPGNDWGANRSGVLTADGDVAFGPGSTLYLNIIGNGSSGAGTQQPGTQYDQLKVNGNVTIATGVNGATLTGLVDTTTVRLSNQFVVVRATGTITGKFVEAAASPGSVFVDGYKFNISYPTDPVTGDSLVVLEKVKVNTTTTLASSNAFSATNGSPSTVDQPVTFTAAVTAEPGSRVPPPGTTFVQFYDGVGASRTPLGPRVPISAGGVAILTVPENPAGSSPIVTALSAGTHTISADYIVDGDGDPTNDDFNPSTSNALTQEVEQPAVSAAVTAPVGPISPANPSPASVGVNDTLQLTATVTSERSAYTPTLTVSTSGGTVVYRQVLPAVGRVQPLNTSQFTATWDGKYNVGPNAGQFVPDGDYQAVITILDEWDRTPLGPTATAAAVTVRVDNTNPVATGAVNAPVIKPGNATSPPPAQTVFSGTVTDANLGTWKVTVRDAGGATVKTFAGVFAGSSPQPVNVAWDGTADPGYPVNGTGTVADGRYTLTLDTTDAAGNTNSGTPVVRTVYVITTDPSVTLLTGLSSSIAASTHTTYGDTVTLTAVVALPAFVQAADVSTFLSGKPVTFDFPGTTQMTSNLAFNAALNRYQASVTVPQNLEAGTYSPITATFLATAELPRTAVTGSHTVDPAALRVTAVNTSRPYAEPNPPFTTSSYVVNTADLKYGDTVAVVTGLPTTTAVLTSNVGAYPITQGTVSTLPNSHGVPNYTVQFTNGVLGVTPVPLTIQVNDATRARFGKNPAFTASYSGFKLNDGPGVVSNLNLVTNAQTNSPIGTYSIFSSTQPTALNYFPITVLPGTLTVTGSANVTVVGSGSDSPAQAQVLSPAGEPLDNYRLPAAYNGGIRTASADFNKDGVADYVLGSGPGTKAFVEVIDGANGATLFQSFPFDDFTGGVFVAAGDMTGDGVAELVVTPDEGGGPRVVIYRGGDFAPLVSYFAIDDANFRGGVRPAVGDLNGDGFADLAVSAGFGGGPRISLWDGQRLGKLEFVNLTNDFFAFEPDLRNGAFVAIGDVNGDGLGDLIAGAGPGGGPRVKVYDGRSLLSVGGTDATVIANFFAGNVNNRGGVKVATKNLDGDKFIDVVTGGGKGDRAVATAYRGSSLTANSPAALYEYDLDGTLNGVFVG